VIAIQSRKIPGELLAETTQALLSFIKSHRGSNNVRVLLTVGAAIRKLLLNLDKSDLAIAAELLKADGNLELPIEVELEVAKMVVHRFRFDPGIDTTKLGELAAALIDNARWYSTPKMVNRDKYDATALNSFLAVLLMQRPESLKLCGDVIGHAPEWFTQMARRRLEGMIGEWSTVDREDASKLCRFVSSLPLMQNQP